MQDNNQQYQNNGINQPLFGNTEQNYNNQAPGFGYNGEQQQQQYLNQPPQQQQQYQDPTQMVQPQIPQQNQFQNQQQGQNQFGISQQTNILESINYMYILEGKSGGCNDIAWCQPLTVEWYITDKNQNQRGKIMIQDEKPGNCQGPYQGKIMEIQADSQDQNVGKEIYQTSHDRKCCCIKYTSICGIVFLIASKCCRSNSKLLKDNRVIANYKYGGCCAEKLVIYDDNMDIKYKVDSESCFCNNRIRKVYDSSGQELPIEVNSNYRNQMAGDQKSQIKTDTTIDFGTNPIGGEEKMALVYGLAKIR